MTLYVLYDGTLYIRHPEYVREGDHIYWVSSESRDKWDFNREKTAKDVIGKIITMTARNYIFKVQCVDAGMWSGWKLEALFQAKARGDIPDIPNRGYRMWRKWDIIGILEKETQRRII